MANVIKESTVKAPNEYEAYYYEWYDITTDMTYGGKHKGLVEDEYKHSSQNPIMHEDFQDMEHEWEFSVLHYGDDDYILNKERDILKFNIFQVT